MYLMLKVCIIIYNIYQEIRYCLQHNIFRMAMMPDEKYPDVSLHPSNAAVLYGTLQKGINGNFHHIYSKYLKI